MPRFRSSHLALLAKRPLNVTAVSIFALAPFMILTATLFYLQEKTNDNAKNWVMHTYEVVGHVHILSSQVKDADIGLREYIGAPKNSSGGDIVSPQMEPNHSIDEETSIIRTLTLDNPVQQKHLDEMNIHMKELLEYWAATIQMRHASGTTGAPQFDFRRWSQLTDNVGRLASAMIAEENRLLSLRIKASADSTRRVEILTFCGIVFFYIVLVLSVWFYQRNRKQSDTIQNKLIENLAKSNAEIKASEETFRLAMDYAPIGMALADLDGRWLKVNQALCDLLGYEQDELLANDVKCITHPDDSQRDLDYMRRVLADDFKTPPVGKTLLP